MDTKKPRDLRAECDELNKDIEYIEYIKGERERWREACLEARAALDEANRDCVGLRAVYEAARTWCETVYIGEPHPRYPAYPGDELLHAVNLVKHTTSQGKGNR